MVGHRTMNIAAYSNKKQIKNLHLISHLICMLLRGGRGVIWKEYGLRTFEECGGCDSIPNPHEDLSFNMSVLY